MSVASNRRSVDYSANYFSSPQLATFRTAIQTVNTVPVNVVMIGSSTTAGNNSTGRTKSYTALLEKTWQNWFNSSHIGGIFQLSQTWGTGGTVVNISEGLALRSTQLSAGATHTQHWNPFTGVTVLYAEGNNAQPFTISIDGGAATTITPATSGSTRYTGIFQLTGLIRKYHDITITATNGAIINGAYFHDGDESSGVRVYLSGLSGATAASFTKTSTYEMIGALQPQLVMIMIGSNEYNNGLSIATYTTNTQAIIDSVNAKTTCSIVLVQTYKRLDTLSPAHPWTEYGAALQSLAATNNALYVDISSGYPTTNDSTGDPLNILDTDSIHQTDAGHSYQANLLANAIK